MSASEAQLSALEAILMVTPEPVPAAKLGAALDLSEDQVEDALAALAAEYRGANGTRPRGFELRRTAPGWRFYSAPAWYGVVEAFVAGNRTVKLSQAAWETLAIIAYRQPVTRAVISSIRGVAVDGVIRTLLGHDLIEEAGQGAGGALTYRTTDLFAEKMGLAGMDQLPALAPHLPQGRELQELEQEVEAGR